MPSLETTNLILAVLAAVAGVQLLLIVGTIVVAARKLERLSSAVAGLDLAALQRRATDVTEDLHATIQSARTIVDVVGSEVNRVSRVMNTGFGFVEHGYRHAFAIGAGVRSGIQELLGGRSQRVAAHERPRPRASLGTGT
jgi:hypothetical protein